MNFSAAYDFLKTKFPSWLYWLAWIVAMFAIAGLAAGAVLRFVKPRRKFDLDTEGLMEAADDAAKLADEADVRAAEIISEFAEETERHENAHKTLVGAYSIDTIDAVLYGQGNRPPGKTGR